MGQTTSQSPTPPAAQKSCPVDHKALAAASAPAACPVEHETTPKLAQCPVDHGALDSRNQMPHLPNHATASQDVDLPTSRTISSIPRDASSKWEYPSPQQFYNALVRKGNETPEELAHAEEMVEIHNFLNEQAWQEVLKWEKRVHASDDVHLTRFKGRPGEISPKARMVLFAGWLLPSYFNTEPPFDRHDWVVKRPQTGEEVRYVIDYYSAPPEPDGSPVFNLDVRPALDSLGSIGQRIASPEGHELIASCTRPLPPTFMNSSPPSPGSSQPSRKRQRSSSSVSDGSSSSVKRSLSDGPSLETAALSLSDASADADAYMADIDKDTITFAPAPSPSYASVPPAEKIARVNAGKTQRLQIGATWYLVDRTWWKRFENACGITAAKEGPVTEDQLGPVDNSALVGPHGELRVPLSDTIDFELVAERVWTDLVAWYGPPTHPLPRQVVPRGISKEASVELYPLRLTVLRMVDTPTTTESDPAIVVVSVTATVEAASKLIAAAVRPPGMPETAPRRVWRANKTPAGGFDSVEFPLNDYAAHELEILESGPRALEEVGIGMGDVFVVEFKTSLGWLAPMPEAQLPPLEPAPLFNSGEGFFQRMGPQPRQTSSYSIAPYFKSSSSYTGPVAKPIEPGTLGLGNMGNTCFMNSALQCLAHQPELVDYFLNGVYQEELNRDNPLGMKGAIAEAFGDLLKRIWASTSPSTSYSPREFKSQLQRFAPQFSGYQQHDSQELVAFLLDGLHEDLNRVIKKPYVEKPDWEGGGDLELVKLAQKSWEGYMLRNDSVIVDLFQGQYQSTLRLVLTSSVQISITFDPFMYLTLPLPVQKKWVHKIQYVPWDSKKPHLEIPVQIGIDASFKEVRQLLGRWMDVPAENLLTVESFSHKIYKSLDDNVPVVDMGNNDRIICYELPCNSQQSRTYKKQDGDPIVLPVYLCDLKATRSNLYGSSSSPTYFGLPTILVLNPDEASDQHVIYEALVHRIARWAKNEDNMYNWEHGGVKSEPISIPIPDGAPADSVVEITVNGNGDVVEHAPEVAAAPEGDITDEKAVMVADDDDDVSMEEIVPQMPDTEPVRVGVKPELFAIKIQPDVGAYGVTAYNSYGSSRAVPLSHRVENTPSGEPLVQEGDLILCEFDENLREFFFGPIGYRDKGRWDDWDDYEHPEFSAAMREAESKQHVGISLQDCLDEFTKKEQLGEDDLWYCPKCKKHQQATKKFDLWKAPDILVVHLKRFSNSRTLRDKIDAFVEFPIEGLDLSGMVGEQAAAKRLLEAGVPLEELELGNPDEPLVYDLFGVDEHMGGLGGGHYRAYALNHANDKWYHFDDSYVTESSPKESVNRNAYLLFYRRRTAEPLGGATHEKIAAARQKRATEPTLVANEQPSTEPTLATDDDLGLPNLNSSFMPRIISATSASSPSSSLEPPDLEEVIDDLNPLDRANQQYDFPDPASESSKASPTSSTEADGGDAEEGWRSLHNHSPDWSSPMEDADSPFISSS
ncbi:hypothetical protein HMN09_00676200 [Mycena chlorophos]|uniref:Holocytochrome-c synthase n=1 Tax=Mycena chlorophos TaxID=658473 RepID=A0A8H6W834_MYCCL|nr:hypothetical protein HMN09_00676200 [Mycena chlorophos]